MAGERLRIELRDEQGKAMSLDEVMRTVTDAALHEVAADAVFVLIDDGSGKLVERTRVRHPSFVSNVDLADLGVLSAPRLEQHFVSDRRFRVHG